VSAEKLLSELRALDIRLFLDDDRLRCSAPKGRLTEDLEKRIAAHKPELIRTLRAAAPQPDSIPRRADQSAAMPLSFAQESFWFLQQMEPDSSAYNITAYRRILTRIDTSAWQAALSAILRRHEILRTNFPEVDGSPVPVVREDATPEFTVHDVAEGAASDRTAATDALIQSLSTRQFDLARDLLFRGALIRLGEEDYLLVLTMHHIVADGWSIGILFRELISLYESHSQGAPASLPELPVQFADYAVWERERATTAILTAQIEYWKKKLERAPRYLDIPADRPHTALTGFAGGIHQFHLDAATSESMKRIARQEGCTLFMALLAVFKALLSRYAGQSDILVGTPVSTRTRPELELLVGCFINTLVLRTPVSSELTTRQLLARVRDTVLQSLSNPDVPFEKLLNELHLERDPSRSPLFQVAFILQNTPMASEYLTVGGGSAFDMTLYAWESSEGIGLSIEYRTELFNAETMARFAECFRTLAAKMVARPETAIGQLAVVTPAQRAEWFRESEGPVDYPRDLCAHQWIEQQAARTPGAIAVVCGGEQVTYQELNVRSNRLAHWLRALGVGPDSLVGLCLDRSVDLLVAPLAIWKAGGAYVPLDPQYPSNRLAFMLEDSGATVLVTQSPLLNSLPRVPSIVCLDRDRHLLENESSQAPVSRCTPGNLAYVIYTSGSTGKPKGVEITHRSLVNFLASMQQRPGIGPRDRLLAVTTLSFDIAALELYLPLVSGARVILATREVTWEASRDGTALTALLGQSSATMMQATPVTWRLLLEAGWQGDPDLKILCGGEALPRDLADRLLATGAEVWNLYGPTETAIWSTVHRVDDRPGPVPIGSPIANTQVLLLDEAGQAVPPGVAGELFIGGDGLARGYLRRPELTAEKFVDDPFHPGERLYRTGDLARWLPDGNIEWVARMDHQVKLRGFRIELGEIEAALERQPGIRQAVVVREDTGGDQRLVAYVTAEDRATPDPRVLRKALLDVLPHYMLPAAFVPLDEFPLTPNRKVDRKALLSPEYRAPDTAAAGEADQLQPAGGYEPPSTFVEQVMTEIWSEVLNVPRVGVSDNFFELGGHSLSATRLIALLRAAFSIDLPLRCIFIDPTIAGLARHIHYDVSTQNYRYTSDIPRWNCLVPAQPKGTRTPIFLVAGYQGPDDTLLVLSRIITHLGLDQPVFGFRPRWIEGIGAEYASVEEVAREFIAELRVVQPRGPYLLGGHCVGGIVALEIAQQLVRDGEEVKMLALLDTIRPTAGRAFLVNFNHFRYRLKHMLHVIGQVITNSRSRPDIIRGLIHRKFQVAHKHAAFATTNRFYAIKTRYWRLMYKYRAKPFVGHITLIANEEQARFEKDLGWEGVAQAGLEVHQMPGDHGNMLTLYSKEVAGLLRKCIDEALPVSGRQEDRTGVGVS
jgi:amino acid adenylation domain-containing protein